MFILILFIWDLFTIINCEIPCEKLNYLGDTIQNKALLSPIVMIGKAGMKIEITKIKYKLTIEIVRTIKGSIGSWNKSILIAGEFSTFKDEKNTCQFQSSSEVEQIYFLKVISENNGEYQVLFNPEMKNEKQLNAIKKTICEGCSKFPTVNVQDLSKSIEFFVAECIGDGFPPPVTKWIVSKRYTTTIIEPINNGIRLIQPVNNSTNEFYECQAMNAIGSVSHSIKVKSIIFTAPVILTRCSKMDQEFCNGNGKCFNDKTENDSKFCRCNKGFDGPNCVSNSTMPDDLLQRRKELDKEMCNNRGKLYEIYKTKAKYCECNSNAFGDTCDKIIVPRAPAKEDKSLKEIIIEQTSKLAVTYILIGCLIVLAGCVIVIIVIAILWRYCFLKMSKNDKKRNSGHVIENNTNHTISDNLVKPIPPHEENSLLLTNIRPNKSPIKTNEMEMSYKGLNQHSGNGIYDNY